MLADAGFAIFVSGNKRTNSSTGPTAATGVVSEFEMAALAGVIPIPVGASGHVAEELWHRVRADPSKYFSDARSVSALDLVGQTSLNGCFLLA